MNRRLIALLLVLVLGLPSFAPQPASAHQSEAASHCSEMSDAPLPHDPADASDDHGCCPSDSGLMTCAAHCALASAGHIASCTPSIMDNGGSNYEPLASSPLLSRFDIPPTPPPIA